MRILGLNITRASQNFSEVVQSARSQELAVLKEADPTAGGIDIDTLMARLHAVYDTVSGIHVDPESCMRAPTVQAIVQAISRRIATLPVQVLKRSYKNNREIKEKQPDHPVQKLLKVPNNWQSEVSWWLDKGSYLTRYGTTYDYKARGKTGPIRRLVPMHPRNVEVEQDDDFNLTFKYQSKKGQQEYSQSEVHYVRGPSRDGVCGTSPVEDVRETIALEIAAEKFGATFFGNGAMPFLIFKFIQGSKGFKTAEEQKLFIEDFQRAYSQRNRFKALALPAGMEVSDPVNAENNKAQFLETRKYQRTVIAGAWGVPPHLVGDLTSGTFNNVEQQSIDFINNVVYPYIRMFEAQMEIDLLTPADRVNGIIIRFNLDAALRGDFASRQSGLNTQRRAGVINANEWRERENMNPRDDPEGEDYWVDSGVTIAGEEPPAPESAPRRPSEEPAPTDSNEE